MRQVKTAKGKIIDMAALAKMHEESRAVGNIPMNARGDRLGSSGNVIATVQSVARKQHENAEPIETHKMSTLESGIAMAKTSSKSEVRQNAPTNLDEMDSSVVISSKKSTSNKKTKSNRNGMSAKKSVGDSNVKTRDDGSRYIETEHADGSITVEEVIV